MGNKRNSEHGWIWRHRLVVASLSVLIACAGLFVVGYESFTGCERLTLYCPTVIPYSSSYSPGYQTGPAFRHPWAEFSGGSDTGSSIVAAAPPDSGSYTPQPDQTDVAYNAKLDNNDANPRTVSDGHPVAVDFFIGGDDPRNIVDEPKLSREARDYIQQRASDRYVPFTVSLVCLACENQSQQTKDITFIATEGRSDVARWIITPSASRAKDGIGELKFIIMYKGGILDVRRARVYFGKVSSVAAAAAASGYCPQNMNLPRGSDVVILADLEGEAVVMRVDVHDDNLANQLASLTRSGSSLIKYQTSLRTENDRQGLLLDTVKQFAKLNEAPLSTYGLKLTDPQSKEVNDVLLDVGSNLYSRLISKRGGNLREIFRTIEAYGTRRAREGKPLRIAILTTGKTDIPWQLLHDPNADPGPAEFWGNKYILFNYPILNDTCELPSTDIVASPDNKVVYIQFREPADKAVSNLSEQYGSYLSKQSGPTGFYGSIYSGAKSPADLRGYIAKNSRDIVMIAAFTHGQGAPIIVSDQNRGGEIVELSATGPALKFSNNELLRSHTISDWARGYGVDNYYFAGWPIVFLDGCSTGTVGGVASPNGDPFQYVFLENGARAVIVTEAPILSDLGSDFGKLFFKKLMAGDTIAAAIFSARKSELLLNNNPLGLLYTLYGNGSTRTFAGYASPSGYSSGYYGTQGAPDGYYGTQGSSGGYTGGN